MKCIYKTVKMCFVTITQHSWLIIGQKSCVSSPLFAQLQSIKISDITLIIPRQVKRNMSMKFLEYVHIFALSWELVSNI